jgi:hypothetical protein
MNFRHPVLLLWLWLLLPVGGMGDVRRLAGLVLLNQVRSIYLTQWVEQKLQTDSTFAEDSNELEQMIRHFLLALWLEPNNGSAYAYLGILATENFAQTDYEN